MQVDRAQKELQRPATDAAKLESVVFPPSHPTELALEREGVWQSLMPSAFQLELTAVMVAGKIEPESWAGVAFLIVDRMFPQMGEKVDQRCMGIHQLEF